MLRKPYSLGICLAGCLLAAGTAHAQNEQYAKAQLAISDVDGFGNGLALVGTYGMKLPQVHQNFSVEGELTTTIVNPDTSVFGHSLEASYYSLGAYAVYTHPINQQVELYGRGGLLYLHTSIDYYTVDWFGRAQVESSSDNDIEPTIGFGTNISFMEGFDFTAGATIISSDITHLGAGVQFKF
ncbi:MAG: outer membrane beta-barrel protein [Pseudomonadota bacterium]